MQVDGNWSERFFFYFCFGISLFIAICCGPVLKYPVKIVMKTICPIWAIRIVGKLLLSLKLHLASLMDWNSEVVKWYLIKFSVYLVPYFKAPVPPIHTRSGLFLWSNIVLLGTALWNSVFNGKCSLFLCLYMFLFWSWRHHHNAPFTPEWAQCVHTATHIKAIMALITILKFFWSDLNKHRHRGLQEVEITWNIL